MANDITIRAYADGATTSIGSTTANYGAGFTLPTGSGLAAGSLPKKRPPPDIGGGPCCVAVTPAAQNLTAEVVAGCSCCTAPPPFGSRGSRRPDEADAREVDRVGSTDEGDHDQGIGRGERRGRDDVAADA